MSTCTPPPILHVIDKLDNSEEAKIEIENFDFTGWTAVASVYESHNDGSRLGEVLFTPPILEKQRITGLLSYSVDITREEVDNLVPDNKGDCSAILEIIFIDNNGRYHSKGHWRIFKCL